MKVRNFRRYFAVAGITMILGAALSTPVAAQGSVAPPIPYPDPTDIGLGGGTVTKLPMDQIV
ncbi:MAG: hypothetical protein ABI970_22335, partial [Chloroflexota bacterium]